MGLQTLCDSRCAASGQPTGVSAASCCLAPGGQLAGPTRDPWRQAPCFKSRHALPGVPTLWKAWGPKGCALCLVGTQVCTEVLPSKELAVSHSHLGCCVCVTLFCTVNNRCLPPTWKPEGPAGVRTLGEMPPAGQLWEAPRQRSPAARSSSSR